MMPEISAATALSGVFGASLLGSLHCAGMCGPLAAVASAPMQITSRGQQIRTGPWWHASGASSFALAMIYNLGRAVTYVMAGAAAGAIGSTLNFGASAVGIQRAATLIAGTLLLLIALVTLLQYFGLFGSIRATPRFLTRALNAAHTYANRFGPAPRALAIGLLTALLPCGWLYAFFVAAGGTGSAARGALVMLVFWLGTVPVMTALGAGLHSLLRPVQRHLPIVTACSLILVGVWSIAWRSSPVLAASADMHAAPQCPLCDIAAEETRK